MKILTISIAAYNVEKFLDKTLSSLCNESLSEDLEVLIIDDGSKDKTGDIAKQYEKKYPNIFRYVYKENGGHGSTINKGIELAQGKYFRVLDGDDYFSTEALTCFIERLKKTEEDVVISDYRCVDEHGKIYCDPYVKVGGSYAFSGLLDNNIYDVDDTLMTSLLFVIPSITIKVELLKTANVYITEKCFYVDMEYDLYAILLAKRFVYFKTPIYMYFKSRTGRTDNSVAKKNMIKNIAMQEKVLFSMIDIYRMYRGNIFLEEKKKLVMSRISTMLGGIIRTYMLMPESSEKIRLLDLQIKNKSCEVYEMVDDDRFIRYVRRKNYILVPFIKVAYKIWLMCKG